MHKFFSCQPEKRRTDSMIFAFHGAFSLFWAILSHKFVNHHSRKTSITRSILQIREMSIDEKNFSLLNTLFHGRRPWRPHFSEYKNKRLRADY